MRDTRNFKWMCILVIREVSSLSPLQFISVIRKQTLPYQAETQDRHQVAVESCVILREEETHLHCVHSAHCHQTSAPRLPAHKKTLLKEKIIILNIQLLAMRRTTH